MDAVEKIITVLRLPTESYLVIVPSWANRGGTVVALSAQDIILGVNSERGPIDPQRWHPDYRLVPAEFLAQDESEPVVIRKMAETSVMRTRQLAEHYLRAGMLRDRSEEVVARVIEKIALPATYGSHGAVIDYTEARTLSLSATYLPPDNNLWERIGLLYGAYDYDIKQKQLAKIFEGAVNSLSRPPISSPRP